MKQIFLLAAILFSVTVFGQTSTKPVVVDTAAQRKQQEEIQKFVVDLVSKTSIKDFQAWLYEMNAGVKDFEAFNKLYNAFIEQKYKEFKAKK